MNFKKILPIFICALILSGCQKKADTTQTASKTNPNSTKLLLNQLEMNKRPFVLMSQHTSAHLLTLYIDKMEPNITSSLDLEYLAGDLLKGARASLPANPSLPYGQSVLLGSCSSGGKCSFDKDLKTGTMKFRLDYTSEKISHILKGDLVFVTNSATTPDGKVTYTPQKGTDKMQLVINTLGLPKEVTGEIVGYPIAITAPTNKIKGELVITAPEVKNAYIFDGTTFQTLKFVANGDSIKINLSQSPYEKTVSIVRDDLKGVGETSKFYVLGPIVLTK